MVERPYFFFLDDNLIINAITGIEFPLINKSTLNPNFKDNYL